MCIYTHEYIHTYNFICICICVLCVQALRSAQSSFEKQQLEEELDARTGELAVATTEIATLRFECDDTRCQLRAATKTRLAQYAHAAAADTVVANATAAVSAGSTRQHAHAVGAVTDVAAAAAEASAGSTRQHSATHCNTLQVAAAHCNARSGRQGSVFMVDADGNQVVAAALSSNALHGPRTIVAVASVTPVLARQHTATHCSTLQHTASHCNPLQPTAAHCNAVASVTPILAMSSARATTAAAQPMTSSSAPLPAPAPVCVAAHVAAHVVAHASAPAPAHAALLAMAAIDNNENDDDMTTMAARSETPNGKVRRRVDLQEPVRRTGDTQQLLQHNRDTQRSLQHIGHTQQPLQHIGDTQQPLQHIRDAQQSLQHIIRPVEVQSSLSQSPAISTCPTHVRVPPPPPRRTTVLLNTKPIGVQLGRENIRTSSLHCLEGGRGTVSTNVVVPPSFPEGSPRMVTVSARMGGDSSSEEVGSVDEIESDSESEGERES